MNAAPPFRGASPMSKPTLPARPRRHGQRRLLLSLLLLVAGAVGYCIYTGYAADRELAKVIAETDRTDPDWRLEQIEEKRARPSPPRTTPPKPSWRPTVCCRRSGHRCVIPARGNAAGLGNRLNKMPPGGAARRGAAQRPAQRTGGTGQRRPGGDQAAVAQTGGRYAIAWGTKPLDDESALPGRSTGRPPAAHAGPSPEPGWSG